MLLAHISDTHIRNYKYHSEYRAVFAQLFDKLREQKVDAIIHCGDIAHTKTQLSPEYFQLAAEFLAGLADIAPTYVILGNHDGNLKNGNRQDAVTPIVNALQHPNIVLLKDAGETVISDDICLNVLSVFDEDNWIKPTDESKINIALYHGAISGVKTDIGWTMEEGEHTVSIFEPFDYAFLGDIHKTNQALDKAGKIRYPGSTVQQNFGETNDKGYLLWDVQSKDEFTCEHHVLDNPRPFITIPLTKSGRMPKGFKAPLGARLRLMSENNLSVQQMHKAMDVAQQRFKPESVTFLNRSAGQRGDIDKFTPDLEREDLRDVAVVEALIKEYLKDYEITEDVLQRIYDLNRKYTSIVEENEEISRNVNWQIRDLQWCNLFNYGTGNRINFDKMNGIVGIFGKNFSGKSSIVDSLLYTIYNTTSKNERKNLNVINQNRDTASGKVEIVIGDSVYIIEREAEKYQKKLKGEVTTEARVDLNFERRHIVTGEVESLNGLTRNDTDKNIRRVFGTIEDFLNTSMSSQLDSLSFIREGSTKRKEILANFLDLNIFEKKYKLAKEASADLKGALRRMGDRDFEEEIKEAERSLYEAERALIIKNAECRNLNEESDELRLELSKLEEKINSAPSEPINIKKVRSDLESFRQKLTAAEQTIESNNEEVKNSGVVVRKMESFLQNFNIDELTEKEKQFAILTRQITQIEKTLRDVEKKKELLSKVPCGDSFPSCMFIKDAVDSSKEEQQLLADLTELQASREELAALNLSDNIQRHNDIYKKKQDTSRRINELQLEVEVEKNNSATYAQSIKELEEKESTFEANREAIENLEQLLAEQKRLKKDLTSRQKQLTSCDAETVTYQRSIGSNEQKLETLKEQQQEVEDLRQEFAAFDLFMRCMHSNGIAYDIIKKSLPLINEEVAKVLANLTEFEVFFEEAGNKLEIFIKHPGYDPRPLSMASGAEKTMSAMAIRLALLTISSLPKSNVMILDEPGTALDETHLFAFTQMLEMIKEKFKTVFLISHLDTLKDVADITIEIGKKDGFAFVRED